MIGGWFVIAQQLRIDSFPTHMYIFQQSAFVPFFAQFKNTLIIIVPKNAF